MIEKIIPFAHRKISESLKDGGTSVDMTCGNGNDTLYLSALSSHVYAFDIQKEAILNTNFILSENSVTNVSLIHDSHINISNHVKTEVSCIVFNLGYLPGVNKKITTKSKDTIKAIKDSLELIKINGSIVITLYPGHKEGNEEANDVKEFCSKLLSNKYDVLYYYMLNKNNSPFNIIIERLR